MGIPQETEVRRCRNDHSIAYQVPIANTNISVAFSPRPLGIGMHFQTLLSPLLTVLRMVLPSSLLCIELGTTLPGHDSHSDVSTVNISASDTEKTHNISDSADNGNFQVKK